eukprot:541186-Rhodomonas_salina.1
MLECCRSFASSETLCTRMRNLSTAHAVHAVHTQSEYCTRCALIRYRSTAHAVHTRTLPQYCTRCEGSETSGPSCCGTPRGGPGIGVQYWESVGESSAGYAPGG